MREQVLEMKVIELRRNLFCATVYGADFPIFGCVHEVHVFPKVCFGNSHVRDIEKVIDSPGPSFEKKKPARIATGLDSRPSGSSNIHAASIAALGFTVC